MTDEERESLVRRLEVAPHDVLVRGLVDLVDGRVDVLQLPGGWRVRAAERSVDRGVK